MCSKNKVLILLFPFLLTSNVFDLPALAQNDDINVRITRQMRRIKNAEQGGVLEPEQAKRLRNALNDIALKAEVMRKNGQGKLTANQITKFDNDLNQNANNIKTQLGAGTKVKVKGNVLGPSWAAGTDGAQDPKTLRRQMKLQERRQLKQYDQAMQQVQEMQQQQYEKDMLQTLGQQRPQILKNKEQIEKVREMTGAN